MKVKANESFSAFLDGEASELDIQRMLKALDEQPEVFEQWHGLSKTQACLQGDMPVNVAMDYTSIDQNQTGIDKKSSWGFRVFQGGIAAAVALVVVTTVNLTQPKQVGAPIAKAVVTQEVENTALAQQQFEAQQRLDLYLREHAEQASFTTGHVVVPADLEWVEAESE